MDYETQMAFMSPLHEKLLSKHEEQILTLRSKAGLPDDLSGMAPEAPASTVFTVAALDAVERMTGDLNEDELRTLLACALRHMRANI